MKALHRFQEPKDPFVNELTDEMRAEFVGGFHSKQRDVISAMLDPEITTVFAACGRKFGKTQVALYCLYRHALLNPNSMCYYICPTRTDGLDIVWEPKRLQEFLGPYSDYFIRRIDNRKLSVELINGSVISIRGAERYENANGLSPSIMVYDEFKAFHKEFHRTMSMNKISKGAKHLIIGTKADNLALNKKEYWALYNSAKTRKRQVLIEADSFENPIVHRPSIMQMMLEDIEDLRAQGREETVQREYYNKIIPGGKDAVFPGFDPKKCVKSHEDIMKEINGQYNELQFYQIMDPATKSTYGSLFIAHSPYTGKVYIMDEVYESDREKMGITKIFPIIRNKAKELSGSEDFMGTWYPVYDEAAAWAAREIMDNYNIAYVPTDKKNIDKNAGISLINYLLSYQLMIISDRCENLIEEVLSYKTDKNGLIKKGLCEDHLIDCLRYFLQACHYTVNLESKNINVPKSDLQYTESLEKRFKTNSIFDIDLDMDLDVDLDDL